MGKKLYTSDEGGVKFQSNRKPGEVRIPNYVWDIWMPLLGVTEIGVYAVYCRLEMHGKVGKMTLDDIARACRVGKATLYKINEVLTNCGLITINSPKGHDRAIHKTTEIVVHDPPKEIKPELITKYQPDSGYTSLTPWLLSNSEDTTDVLGRTSHSDADTTKPVEIDYKNDVPDRTSELDDSDVPSGTSRSSEQNVGDVPDRTSNSIATLVLQPLKIEEEKTSTTISLSQALKAYIAPAREEREIDFESGEILSSQEKLDNSPPKPSAPKPLVALHTSDAEAWAMTHNQLMLIYKNEDIRTYVDNLLWVGVEDGVGVIGVPTQVGKELCEIKIMRNIQNHMAGLGIKIEHYRFQVMGESAAPTEPVLIHPDAAANGAVKKPVDTVALMRQAREITERATNVGNKEAYATKVYQDLLSKAGAA